MARKRSILALGADMKNRFLFASGGNLRFGPDITDLSNAKNYEKFGKEIKKAAKKINPAVIAHDLHPGYFSTQFAKTYTAKNRSYRLLPVQHHKAHIASVIYERDLKKPVIGVSFDGTGLGDDGNMWGGEFFVVRNDNFARKAHLKYIKMPGGDKAIKEPWRMVVSILGKRSFPFLNGIKKEDKEKALLIAGKNINSPFTSSAGRLFDAAAALLGICEYASYEAEGPIKLEGISDSRIKGSYGFDVSKENGVYVIDAEKIFRGMLRDIKKGFGKAFMATKFHNSIANIVVSAVKKLATDYKIRNIVLSGGVFQNSFLKSKITATLLAEGFMVFANKNTPANDYNISLGQYYISQYA